MNLIRTSGINAPVTKEEVAFKLFSLIAGGAQTKLTRQEVLPTFAKCMMAVDEPEKFLRDVETYNIKS